MDAARFEERSTRRVAAAVGAGADLDAFRASFDLVRVSTRLVQHLESTVHRRAGWSMAGFRVMFCVWVAEELEPRDIARLSGLSRPAVSSVLNTLERDGLIDRQRRVDDRRLVTVRLSADGRARVEAAYAEQHRQERRFFAGLDRPGLTAFDAAMRTVLRTAPRSSPDGAAADDSYLDDSTLDDSILKD